MTARRGAALVLVLWLIVVLGTIGTGVAVATRSTTAVAANYRALVVARYAAESGVTLAVRALEDGMAHAGGAGEARRAYLNDLGRALAGAEAVALGDARALVALVDPGSRLDLNVADASSLAALFSFFTAPPEAERAAAAIRARVAGSPGGQAAPLPEDPFAAGPAAGRPLQSLDELAGIPGVPRELAERAAPFLTVDGDGTINRAAASDTVLAAARGDLRDEPSRILVIARGWLDGHPLTHEIQALYGVVGDELTLIRWRERDL